MPGGGSSPLSLQALAMLSWRSLGVALLMVMLAGCASRDHTPRRQPPPVVVSESTWRKVDSDIVAASKEATRQTTNYARDVMLEWMGLVYQRTDTNFIPWFSGYWTQQWLTMKVGWYRLNAGKEQDPAVDRLAIYLQEQYHGRVLEPVARQIDPDRVMEKAMKFYVWLLGELLRKIPQRYGVPQDQFERRLKGIPAIALGPPPTHVASVHQIIHSEPIDKLPAYGVLVARIRTTSGSARAWRSDADISPVVRRTSKRLMSELATRSASSVVSMAVGRAVGSVLSLGVAGISAMMREDERPEMEALLRKSLNAAFKEKWADLMWDPDTGVLAGVYYLSGQIEENLATKRRLSIQFAPVPRRAPMAGG
jgi:hypothetical protein